MKIIDVAEHYSEEGGGVKTYIDQKLKNAYRLGHEMIIIAPGKENKMEDRHGGKIIWQKNPRLAVDKRYGVFRNQKAIHDLLDEEAPHIVEGSSIWAGGRMASRWKGDALKLFIFHQDVIAAYAHTFLDKYVSRKNIDRLFSPVWAYIRTLSHRYNSTIVSGDWLADRLSTFGINNPVAVPFGIDKSLFSSEKRSQEIRKELLRLCGRSEECPLLLVASRFHPEKRLKTLFKAIRLLNKTIPVGMVVFGEGVLSKADRKYAAETPGIKLAGFTKDRDELARAYASADLMVHGSAAETYGLGVAEALCSGLPVVAPSVGGAADLVADKYGLTYEPGNAEKCAVAIRKAIGIDRDNWTDKLKDATTDINSVEDHFENLFEKYGSLLREKRYSRITYTSALSRSY